METVEVINRKESSYSEKPNSSDLISRQEALKALRPIMRKSDYFYEILKAIQDIPSAQPEEASVILGASKDGVRLWHKCSVCGEPVDAGDNYCCNCGRKFING